ncbi:hypothetical protein C8N40_10844 [Pontibacter mucosus]|uniref:Uncharacterized protein n=1 Tax=Pontibacter mucosus TaxID=1649266 RepID=A0A2T5YEQ2_9BACT|nr:hypothetical protein [Pontibacter mucosus]PTX15157.1 hypothetical protein C8N40_10844 [Pontibacter mucosus]
MKLFTPVFRLTTILCLILLMGCDEDKNFEELAPYRTYTALLNQQDEDAPVATVLENTLNITIEWSRTSRGKYLGTLSQPVDINKSTLWVSTPPTHAVMRIRFNSPTEIYLEAGQGVNFHTDTYSNVSLELKVYK